MTRHFGCFGQQINFYPGSLTRFCADELRKVPLKIDNADANARPVSVFTTGLAPLAAFFVRLIAQRPHFDPMSRHIKCTLCMVLSSTLFDMSYEGNYRVLDEESQEELDRHISRGLDLFQKLEGWRDDEMWIADALKAIIKGQCIYSYLPFSHVDR